MHDWHFLSVSVSENRDLLICSELRSSVGLPSETKEIADKRHCKNGENPSDTQNESFSSPKGDWLKIAKEPVDIGFNRLEKVFILL